MSDVNSPDLLGGRYEVGEVLGRGGMATVRRARDLRLSRDVAVKQLRVDLASDATFQARFRREAQASAGLNHPNIVAVYDTGEQLDRTSGVEVPYIVMEMIDGRTLRDLLRDGRPILPRRAMEFTLGVLDALAYSHRAGIIHRDIKPANVMVTSTGVVKVMDFGIARAVSDTSSTMTQTAAVIGTAQYLSPEQARGEKVDARSDIYSAGCLLYELLVGKPPFTGDSPVSVAYQHVREAPVPPGQLDAEVTPAMDTIVLKALAKSAADRYQTADEMAADIRRLLAGQPIEAVTPVPVPVSVGSTATPVPSAATVLLSTHPDDTGAVTTVTNPVAERRRGRWLWPVITSILVVALIAVVAVVLLNRNSRVQVPLVRGYERTAAEARIRAKNLNPIVTTVAGADDDTVGKVTEQNPPADSWVEPASDVTITVNTGPSLVPLPSGIVGNDVKTVTDFLTKEGFSNIKAVKAQTEPANAKANTILTVDPTEGTRVSLGQLITLYYATGQAVVPNLRTFKCDDAANDASNQGFKVNTVEQTSSTVDEGKVIDTKPAPGATMAKTDTLTIYCAVKPTPTPTVTSTIVVTPTPEPTPTEGG